MYGAAANSSPEEGSSRRMSAFNFSALEDVGTAVSRMRRRAVKIWRETGVVQVEAMWPEVLVRGGGL